MEVCSENHAMLCNFEVLSLLRDIQAGRGQKKPNKYQTNLATITYETIQCLEKSWPCAGHTAPGVAAAMEALAPFGLTAAEKLQLINHRPSTAVEIQLMVEESEERLSEEQVEKLLEVLATHLPHDSDGQAQDGEDMDVKDEDS
ncbi:hypothetical protein EGW08_022795 [Elysia chlorotica]|uniref:DNA-directed RNA polymerase III subunit RPC9 n=1 Tax=Elysia chlorotica TaxID=188477 RepID=A0A3S1BKP9_ELYCH|nr:hypothetical protein EGW08_022795 [Elysia chlorotica]